MYLVIYLELPCCLLLSMTLLATWNDWPGEIAEKQAIAFYNLANLPCLLAPPCGFRV